MDMRFQDREDRLQDLRLWLRNCIIVHRVSEEEKLPKNFVEEMSEKEIVVRWCLQLEVLTHESVGCFMTHCGLNSTLEALTCGFPIVAVPQWTDQPTNAQYIMDFWKMRLKAPVDEKGLVSREAAEHCIREIMEGKRGKEIKKNAIKLRKMAKEARVEVLIRTLKNL
ncbi:UDP-glycosyltransferase 74C1-like [Alnus glutinosa]|uniref:UDP-glycosyltransferase 74C1-like n=1 Tax=Alnus glutinosa TaxID=3517 RepID=UPI002D798AAE|nr:UDP-glycosyltransferase 74C1-like [Alnus glutinosa]